MVAVRRVVDVAAEEDLEIPHVIAVDLGRDPAQGPQRVVHVRPHLAMDLVRQRQRKIGACRRNAKEPARGEKDSGGDDPLVTDGV